MAATCFSYLDVMAAGDTAAVNMFRARVSGSVGEVFRLDSLLPAPELTNPLDLSAWHAAHWGTGGEPFDTDVQESEEFVRYFMATTYGPPFAWLRAVRQMFPTISFRLVTYAPDLQGVSLYVYPAGGRPILKSVTRDKYGSSWVERARVMLDSADARGLVVDDDRFGIGITD